MTSKESPLVSSLEKILSKPVFQKAIAKALAESLASTFEDIQQDRADLADHMAQAAPVVGACSPASKPPKAHPPSGYYCDVESIWVDEPNPFEGRVETPSDVTAPWIPKVGERVRFTRQLASQPDWIVLGLRELPYIHLTRASDGVPSGGYVWSLEPTKRYREPTQADLANGPIECECRSLHMPDWRPQVLFEILDGSSYPYRARCPKNRFGITRWPQCRIEDLPKTQTQTDTGFPVSGIQMAQPPEGWRLLGNDEVLRKGDKRFNVHGKAWDLERGRIGDLVSDSFNTRFIRRNTFAIGERVVVSPRIGYSGQIFTVIENSKITPPSKFGTVRVVCETSRSIYEFCTDVLAPYFEGSK